MNRFIPILCVVACACGPSKPKRANVEKSSYMWPGQTALTWKIFGTNSMLELEPNSSTVRELEASAFDADDTVPEKSRVVGKVVELLPAGTTFSPAAKLTLVLPSGAPSNAVIATGEVDGKTWTELATTRTSTTLSAPVAHFSLFAIVTPMAVVDAGPPVNCDGRGAITGTCTLKTGTFDACTELHGTLSDSQGNCISAGGTFAATSTPCAHTNVVGRCLHSYSSSCQLAWYFTGGQSAANAKMTCQGGAGVWAEGPP